MAEPRLSSRDDEITDIQASAGIEVFDAEIERQQLELIYTQAPFSISAAFILALLMVAGLWPVADHAQLLIWLAVQSVQTVLRLLLVDRFRHAPEAAKGSPQWMLLFFAGTFVAGIVWGCIGLQFSFAWPVEYQTLTLMGLIGVMAGAISSYAVNLSVYIAFLVPTMLIPAQSLLVSSSILTSKLCLMMVLFAAVMLMTARNYNRNAMQLLRTRIANQKLLDEMTQVNSSLQQEVMIRREAEESLRSEQQLFSNGPVVTFRCAASQGWPIEFVSSTISQFGYDAGLLMEEHRNFSDLIHEKDLQRVMEAEIISERDGAKLIVSDYRIVSASGEVRWVYDYTIPVFNPQGEVACYMGYLIDITDRKYAEFELQQEKERAQLTLHSIADAVITTDANGQVEYMNPSAELLTGWDAKLARGMPADRVIKLLDETDGEPVENPMSLCMHSGESVHSLNDNLILNRNGEQVAVRYSASPILATSGSSLGQILVFHDVTQTRNMERKLSYQATHDALTGLLNRSEFKHQLGHLIRSSTLDEKPHVVCVLDIDQFEVINDNCTHEEGDRLLVRIAELLQGCVRETDLIARLGGDEFGMLLRNCSLTSAAHQIDQLQSSIHAVPYSSKGKTFDVGVSIGLAQVRKGSQDSGQALVEANLACYMAKEQGGNRYHVYQSTDKELIRRHDEMKWVARITEAIDNNRLVLYYQPIMPLRANLREGVHFEVLVRMLDEHDKLIMPDRFLPAAERFHLMPAIDRWVVSHSLAWYRQFSERHGQDREDCMSINLSGASITDVRLLGYIKNELQRYGVSPGVICFEITETAAISNLAAATDFIQNLRRTGCRFSLDDFGSGLSSFAYLKNLPVDYLKIDGAFVRNIDSDEVDRTMVMAVQQLGRKLGLKTIAEYVSNARSLELLAEMGVDFAQGYAVAKPAPLASLEIESPVQHQQQGSQAG